MADQGVQEDLYITTTTITFYDNFTGTLEIYTIIRGVWFEEIVFANVRRQVFIIRPTFANVSTGHVFDGHNVWSLPGPEPDDDFEETNHDGGSGL